MKRLGLLVTKFFCLVVFIVFLCSSSITAAENSTKQNSSDAVIGYYDISTKTETLYTREDLNKLTCTTLFDKINSDKLKAKKATSKIAPKKLTNLEKNRFLKAEQNSTRVRSDNSNIQQSNITKDNHIFDNDNNQSTTSNASLLSINRQIISNTNSFPYYSICKLIGNGWFYDASSGTNFYGTSSGTGFAVGNKLCATARHCITDSYGNWLSNIQAYYGYNGESGYYTNLLANLAGYVYFPQYITSYTADGRINTDWEYDIAFLIWNTSTVSLTGCFGMSSNLSNGMSIRLSGYPSSLSNGNRLYEGFGNVSSFSSLKLWYSGFETYGGDSGAPVYDNNYSAFGVHTHGGPSGRRIDGTLIQWLIDAGY